MPSIPPSASSARPSAAPILMAALLFAFQPFRAEVPKRQEPVVTAAAVPMYPLAARAMGWMGDVVIDVKTDGETVSSATLVTEKCLLGEAALENVKTWRFEKHTPTVFRVTYHFRLFEAEPYSRNCEISLHLPFDVEVRAQGVLLVEEKRP